jgi:hypothetical protein
MTKWDYKIVRFDAELGFFRATGQVDLEKAEGSLGELGAQGWELVAVEDEQVSGGATRSIIAFMKRPRG